MLLHLAETESSSSQRKISFRRRKMAVQADDNDDNDNDDNDNDDNDDNDNDDAFVVVVALLLQSCHSFFMACTCVPILNKSTSRFIKVGREF